MDLQEVDVRARNGSMCFRIGTWWTLVNAVINFRVPKKCGKFFD
jgi:hypothetical protein